MAEYVGATYIEKAWLDGMTPDPVLTVSEWADHHRILAPKSSAEPGKWRTSRTPYLREIMDCLSSNSRYERVVFMKGAQIGATEAGTNWLGYVIHHSPGPIMAVWPTVEIARRNSRQRVDPLVTETPELSLLIAPAKSKDSQNTILAKEFRGGTLVMTGANSAAGLRSMPARFLFLDEVDAYPLDVEGEGDAISLAEARTRTFARRKIFVVSTPTTAGSSVIEREYFASDQRRYFVPCPHCGHEQFLQFASLKWERGRPDTVAYSCSSCENPIRESAKTTMLAHGRWIATAPGIGGGKIAGFHLSSLYSPLGWRSWAEIAKAWERANSRDTGSISAIKTFKNTELGEVWHEDTETPDWQRIVERREGYDIGTVPAGGLLLTAGVDIQKNRLEVSIWAWGRQRQAWLVEHQVLLGEPTEYATVWDDLRAILGTTWPHAHGASMSLSKIAIDTGYSTSAVYTFVRTSHDPRIIAIKGVPKGTALVGPPSPVEIGAGGKKLQSGLKLYPVAGNIGKLELLTNIGRHADITESGFTHYPPGYIHLPMINAEFVQQLCAEQLVTKRHKNGFQTFEWQKIRERNEALDCYVYARAAASAIGLDRFEERHWQELERQLGRAIGTDDDAPISPPAAMPPPVTRPARKVVRSKWL